jgi:hypothetical protein
MNAGKRNLALAERHVLEGEERVARQRAIIQRLERDNHLQAAATARDTLQVLEATLDDMRQHLATERRLAKIGRHRYRNRPTT